MNRTFAQQKRKVDWLGLLIKGTILLLLLLAWAWGYLALLFSGPGPDWLKLVSACLFGALLPGIFLLSRSFMRGLFLCLFVFALLLAWWQTLQPSNDKDWATEVARISHGEIQGNRLIMHNVRSFHYTADKISPEQWKTKEFWETREYDLDKIQGLDLFLSYWGSEHIAHTIMSWDFGNQHLAISIETRKDKKQEYSAIKGFFKQFELSYVAADETDLIRLRTNFRKERVYAYRLHVSKDLARALLQSYVTEMNRLVNEPEFYNALTRNCTTTIHLHNKAIVPDDLPPMDWRIIASGHVDELLYEEGVLVQELPFVELRRKSRIDQRMQLYGENHFSRILRYDLPRP